MSLPNLRPGEAWRRLAGCRTMDTSLFYYEKEGARGHRAYPPEVREACNHCPVRKACLEFALANREEYGYWGGTTPTQRKKMLRLAWGAQHNPNITHPRPEMSNDVA